MTTSTDKPQQVVDLIQPSQTDNIPENKDKKTFLYQVSQPPKQFFPTVLVMIWGLLLLILAPMAVVTLEDPIQWFYHAHVPFFYSFQVPAVILVSGVLGFQYGILAITLYLIAGLIGVPVFAGGGSHYYYSELTAGYLVGFLFVPYGIQQMLIKAYRTPGWLQGRSIWIAAGAFVVVLMIHSFGIANITFHGLTGSLSWADTGHWILQISWPSAFYDFVFGFIAAASVRILRMLFSLGLY
jgi:biotin transporter BioY